MKNTSKKPTEAGVEALIGALSAILIAQENTTMSDYNSAVDKSDECISLALVAAKHGAFEDETDLLLRIQLFIDEKRWDFAEDECRKVLRMFRERLYSDHFTSNDENSNTFVLADGAKNQIFDLCTVMKKIVNNEQTFDERHKARLLDRISCIEKEVHKEKGRYDVILGGVVDAGDAFGRFGDAVKPLVDRMAEIRKIIRPKVEGYEELPSPDEVKKLPAPDE